MCEGQQERARKNKDNEPANSANERAGGADSEGHPALPFFTHGVPVQDGCGVWTHHRRIQHDGRYRAAVVADAYSVP